MYHFIGIKGSGMSSLAQIMKSLDMEVQGSDVDKHFFTEEGLRKNNIKVTSFNENNIKNGLEIIQGNAFTDENIEVRKAKELGLPIYTYQNMVGKITRMFDTISIAGCHGKTTTTAMLSHIINNICGANYLIGDGTGYANPKNKYFILEACEYKRHFLEYTQKYGIITNIELDHVDYYKDIDDVLNAYQEFVSNITDTLVAYGDDENILKLNTDKKVFHYGLNDKNNVVARNIISSSEGSEFEVYINGEYYDKYKIKQCGTHMILNSLACITICYLENFDKEEVKKYLNSFAGAKRRFSEEIVCNNVLIDDYAHHPTEIKSTIEAAKQKYPSKKIIAVFQPHTFSRTKEFAQDLVNVLNECDASYILDIHPSREKQQDYPEITSDIIISKLDHGYHIDEINADVLLKYDNAVLLFMSPNDVSILQNDYKTKKRLSQEIIGIGNDRHGINEKKIIIEYLEKNNIKYIDYGTNSEEMSDYVDYAKSVCNAINKEITKGILICRTGIGMSIAANKIKGIRCARVINEEDVLLTRTDNDANVLAIPSNISSDVIIKMIDLFIKTPFSTDERHQRRVKKINEL